MVHPLAITSLALGIPMGPGEWIVIAIVALLLFGKRLPEVGRSLGHGIVEFKKGLKGIENDVEQADAAPPQRTTLDQLNTAYKFDPNTGQPLQPQMTNAAPPGAKFDPYTGKPLNGEVAANKPAAHASTEA